MKYYTADLHFGHEAMLIPKGTRPFGSVEEMNESIVKNINERCTVDDTLYILGDVAQYFNVEETIGLLKRLNPKLVLIVGNHDKSILAVTKKKQIKNVFKKVFYKVIVSDGMLLKDGNYDLFLSHYPICEWDGYYKGRYLFYGHVHNGTQGPAQLMQYIPTAINVGVDVNGFIPKTAKELIEERKATYRIPKWDYEYLAREVVCPNVDSSRSHKCLDMSDFAFKK